MDAICELTAKERLCKRFDASNTSGNDRDPTFSASINGIVQQSSCQEPEQRRKPSRLTTTPYENTPMTTTQQFNAVEHAAVFFRQAAQDLAMA
jgi:hypothetical protein